MYNTTLSYFDKLITDYQYLTYFTLKIKAKTYQTMHSFLHRFFLLVISNFNQIMSIKICNLSSGPT